MMKHIKWFVKQEIVKFIIVGVMNTAVSMIVMFSAYNGFGISDTVSTLIAYTIGSVLSFVLNRSFTFQSESNVWSSALRFTINIAVCYLFAYVIMKPFIKMGVGIFWDDVKMIDNATMLIGSGVFTTVNYFGQKFFTFKKERS